MILLIILVLKSTPLTHPEVIRAVFREVWANSGFFVNSGVNCGVQWCQQCHCVIVVSISVSFGKIHENQPLLAVFLTVLTNSSKPVSAVSPLKTTKSTETVKTVKTTALLGLRNTKITVYTRVKTGKKTAKREPLSQILSVFKKIREKSINHCFADFTTFAKNDQNLASQTPVVSLLEMLAVLTRCHHWWHHWWHQWLRA